MPFKSIFTILSLAFVFIACKPSSSKNESKTPATKVDSPALVNPQSDTTGKPGSTQPISKELSFLEDWKGKYPFDVKLFENPVIKTRLKKLLGSRFDFLKKIWDVETPIEINDNLFYAWAMQAHSGDDPGAVIMADLVKNIFYVGIRQDNHVKIYSEDGSPAPEKLTAWGKEGQAPDSTSR